jgi:hypothetical protein
MRASIRGASTRLALSAAAAAALITAGGAAGAVGAQAASAATVPGAVAIRPIHQVRCSRTTFQVAYRAGQALREKCYEGTGRISPDIRNVRVIRTGINTGSFTLRTCRANEFVFFRPGETFKALAGCSVTLETLDITRA